VWDECGVGWAVPPGDGLLLLEWDVVGVGALEDGAEDGE
jgi:hypothetical protein